MLWVLAGLLLLLVGAVWIRLGAWPPRVGETPHCRRCDYIVGGLPEDSAPRCPECGLTLTAPNVVYGERLRRRGRIVRGGAVMALGLGFVGMGVFEPLNAVNWYGLANGAFRSYVPASVPSERNNLVWVALLATKTSCPLTAVIWCGSDEPEPALRSLTCTVPRRVPSVFHSSFPAPPLAAK